MLILIKDRRRDTDSAKLYQDSLLMGTRRGFEQEICSTEKFILEAMAGWQGHCTHQV